MWLGFSFIISSCVVLLTLQERFAYVYCCLLCSGSKNNNTDRPLVLLYTMLIIIGTVGAAWTDRWVCERTNVYCFSNLGKFVFKAEYIIRSVSIWFHIGDLFTFTWRTCLLIKLKRQSLYTSWWVYCMFDGLLIIF